MIFRSDIDVILEYPFFIYTLIRVKKFFINIIKSAKRYFSDKIGHSGRFEHGSSKICHNHLRNLRVLGSTNNLMCVSISYKCLMSFKKKGELG